MSYVMFGFFPKYGGWPMTIIETCQRFYEKYNRYPNFIRMKEKTMDALFDENEKAALDPSSEEHTVRDTNGNLLIPIHRDDDTEEEIDSFNDDNSEEISSSYENEDFESIIDEEPEENDEDCIRPVEFGVNDDCTVSFITNKFELMFLEGDDLPDNYFIVQFGDGPDDGGEDLEEETEDVSLEIKSVA